jgi:hypothetical protein
MFSGVIWYWEDHVRTAPGSDLWPLTWGADSQVYTSWGDGGGFGGDNRRGREALGFGRIEGEPDAFTGINVHGGWNAERPSRFLTGKVSGLASVDGTIYGWLNKQDGVFPAVSRALVWSEDQALSWDESAWAFPPGHRALKPFGFVQYGQDYREAKDGYVYIVAEEEGNHGVKYLIRSLRTQLKEVEGYEYFAGVTESDAPIWSNRREERAPFFRDPNWGGGVPFFHSDLRRYLMVTTFAADYVSIFESENLWGPWHTISYAERWNRCDDLDNYLLGLHVLQKWSEDATLWFAFSGGGPGACKADIDALHLIRANLIPTG